MSRVRVRVDINDLKAKAVIHKHGHAAVRRAANTTQRRARQNLIRSGRVNTGDLVRSIKVTQTGIQRYNVGSDLRYAGFQERGIGPVVPVRAKALRFKPKGSNVFVFAQRTRGFEGARYMAKAYLSLRAHDFLP